MMRRRTTRLFVGVHLSGLSVGLLMGCAALPSPRGFPGMGSSAETIPPETSVSAGPTSEQTVLSAIETFLERTRDYDGDNVPQTAYGSAPFPQNYPIPSNRPSSLATLPAPRPRFENSLTPSGQYGAVSAPLGSVAGGSAPTPMYGAPPSNISAHPAGTFAGAPLRYPQDEPGASAQAARTVGSYASQAPPPGAVGYRPPTIPRIEALSIRAEAPQSLSATPSMTATNQPLTSPQATNVALIDRFLTYVHAAAEAAQNFDGEWRLRLTQLALNRDSEASAVSSSISEESRTLLTALIHAAQAVRFAANNPDYVDQDVLKRVDELRSVVALRADLSVPMVALCSKVTTFGVYETMDASAFVAGVPTETIVYTEIGNIRSEPTPTGRFLTSLGTRLELLDSEGRRVWKHEEPSIEDECRRRRKDFFIAQRLTFPATLPAGEYVLKLQVEDKLSGRISEAATDLVVMSRLPGSSLP